jgi:hypothetical protein
MISNLDSLKNYQSLGDKLAVCKKTGKGFTDYTNCSGALTKHLVSQNLISKQLTYKERKSLDLTKFFLFVDTLDYIDRGRPVECKICNQTFKTNLDGSLTKHLSRAHNVSRNEYIALFPGEVETLSRNTGRFEKLDRGLKVKCEECSQEFRKITENHLLLHGMTVREYREKFPTAEILAKDLQQLASTTRSRLNEAVQFKKRSSLEIELEQYLLSSGLKIIPNYRFNQIEIDLFIPELKLGIEINGLVWHSEFFGKKNRGYHLGKTEICEKAGIQLVHVFEDEWQYKKELVLSKLMYRTKKAELTRVRPGKFRFTDEVSTAEEREFLEKNHIQGYSPSTRKLGAYLDGELKAILTYSSRTSTTNQKEGTVELLRFSVDREISSPGLFSKMLKLSMKLFSIDTVTTFADRRWTSGENNLYLVAGFKLEKISPPNYWYIRGMRRVHRYNFTKARIVKMFNGDPNLTEVENMRKLGYDRIWDCGNYKYVLNT